MRFLLDTHTLIWFLNGDKALSSKARKSIESDQVENYVSIASLWEMAIKISLDRLELNASFMEIGQQISENNFQILPISLKDTVIISNLPFHHRDPFDRMIISQAVNNKLTVISKDSHFNYYDIKVVW